MSDSRWSDVEADVEQALMHFGMAIEIFEAGGFDDPGSTSNRQCYLCPSRHRRKSS